MCVCVCVCVCMLERVRERLFPMYVCTYASHVLDKLFGELDELLTYIVVFHCCGN